ncbi:selenocysteine-specific translation elongation factor [Guptibacillus algicola]|uniref:selenocysteine-specific translation elongation factor n=1 Tax=Guptibacillus algicola TaxID=225844 RepID=UPI001CD75AA6|nr:selenocysteine-specific translation elongation factor [Alkalihalobacillus algicola]MCA0988153.1 selenocysteine-specific translation elongation factor [Alkalihalobacillus algicola]
MKVLKALQLRKEHYFINVNKGYDLTMAGEKMKYYTIGLAGHIDHGKTTLTGALTGVDTDRLKEEKERNVSIEPGFAPFELSGDMNVSIIDVPGHERFVRQMIAGVAGIDLVIPVVAADEGVMPQTREHLEILSLLGIERSIIVITKADAVDEEMIELVKDDIREYITGTGFEGATLHVVDSKSGRGIEKLKESIKTYLLDVPPRNKVGPFRLPVDQVFTLQGHGTIVRGTIFDGELQEGEKVTIVPKGIEARVRQVQSHNERVNKAFAGQRVAVNLAGLDREDIERGQVVVTSDFYKPTSTVDLNVTVAKTMSHDLKQRSPVTAHIGTAEVRGTIVFFDRNVLEVDVDEALFCQLRLEQPILAKKGDRIIIRRPSPVETIAGGSIVNVMGKKYKFGVETVEMLKRMSVGTPYEQLQQLLEKELILSEEEIKQTLGIKDEILVELSTNPSVVREGSFVTTEAIRNQVRSDIKRQLRNYHEVYPLRTGLPKAELIQELKKKYPDKLIELALGEQENVKQKGPYLFEEYFSPYFPKAWKTRMENVVSVLEDSGMKVPPIDSLIDNEGIPSELKGELKQFLIEEGKAIELTKELMIHRSAWEDSRELLRNNTSNTFSLQSAKEVLGVSRKFLVPFLESLDEKGFTIRDGQERRWRDN